MARKLRVEYPGAIYHVMNRGDRCERILMDDADSSASLTRRTIFRYDGKLRRRVTREETKGPSGQWVLASETRYVYGGVRVIQERNGNRVPTVAYTRGPDMSGSVEGPVASAGFWRAASGTASAARGANTPSTTPTALAT